MPIVRIDQKLIYFAHVPKCAGTAIERYLSNRFGPLAFLDWGYSEQPVSQRWNISSPQHIDAASFARLMPASFIDASFAVVRHPTQRLLSVFRYQRDAEDLIPAEVSFGSWLRQIPLQDAYYLDNHTRPMVQMVPEGAEVFKLEEGLTPVTDWLDALAGERHDTHEIETLNSYRQRLAFKNTPPGPEIRVTEADHAWIAERYGEDFERFGYAPGPEGLTDPAQPGRAGEKRRKILVFGATGQVATELRRRVPADTKLVMLTRAQADLTDPAACVAQIAGRDVDAVINVAAYTAVDRAEDEEKLAHRINAETPAAMAGATAMLGIPFIHVSTDYVFDGSGETPWKTTDIPAPLGAYGRSKLAGEEGVRAAGGTHVILRTSWVFSAHGANFVRTMLRLAETRDALDVVADQVGGPTAAADIADALFRLVQTFQRGEGFSGTYHFSGAPDVSWADFAREIFAQAGRKVAVRDITTADYPTPAPRPANSRLDCTEIETAFSIRRPDWRASLTEVLRELGALADPAEPEDTAEMAESGE